MIDNSKYIEKDWGKIMDEFSDNLQLGGAGRVRHQYHKLRR